MPTFYLIPDQLPLSQAPSRQDLALAGKMEVGTFIRLKRKGLIEERFHPASDFRWDSESVRSMANALGRILWQLDEDLLPLRNLLDLALRENCGLMAFADQGDM